MYTDVSRYLEEIKARVDKDPYPTAFKLRTRNSLEYFYKQALSDMDRRAGQGELRSRWQEFEKSVRGTRVLDPLKLERFKLNAIKIFMGVQFEEIPPPKAELKKSRFDGVETEHLLDHLVQKCVRRPKVSEIELLVARFGLFYLHMEALRGRSQRNNDRIKEVWKAIQPYLRKAGFLDELDLDQSAVQRLRFFLSNRF